VTLSLAAARALAVSAQGYAGRARRGTADDVEAVVRRLGCVQLDSITAVERSHRIALGARVGTYPRATVSDLTAAGRVFEYWAHEACVIPVEDYPLYKRRMDGRRMHHWYGDVIGGDPKLAERVLGEIRERGPLGSRSFEGKGGGGMWNYKPAKRMLEALWTSGRLAVAGRRNFERLYDLPERVLPAEVLEAPMPDEATYLRTLAVRAVRARGCLSDSAIVEHWRFTGGTKRIRPHLDALVEAGELERHEVDDGGAPLYVVPGAEPDRSTAAVLLSPFDNLIWDRTFTERLFGFRHMIEVYKPAHQRQYGYYVLPFLRGERLVGRSDLKADRTAGVLRAIAFHPEPGVRDSAALRTAFEGALARLAALIGVATIDAPWTSRRAPSTTGRSRIPRPAP
jgi:uncharacterized protein